MRQTLFYIPHDVGPLPVFGWISWTMIAWLVFASVIAVRAARRSTTKSEIAGLLPMFGLVALCIAWLVPSIEERIPTGFLTFPAVDAEFGLPIRGYGVMLLLAVVAAVTLAVHRSQRAGLNSDLIFSLAFYLVVGGILGARLFFIVQYWHLIQGQTVLDTLINMVSVVQGGLVVYGSLIGAAVGFLLFARKHRLHVLALADLVAPSLVLGLAIGRIGCLLNGCCFGGPCHHDLPWLVTFPAESPPYLHQKGLGELHGLTIGPDAHGDVRIVSIDPLGPLSSVDVAVGERVVAINGTPLGSLSQARSMLEQSPARLTISIEDRGEFPVWLDALPQRSKPVHPTQVYSSINAGLLFLLTLAIYPFRRRHGQVIALLLTLYAISRFLLEMIRTDESEFAAQMTISQNISVVVVISMMALWLYVQRQPPLAKNVSAG